MRENRSVLGYVQMRVNAGESYSAGTSQLGNGLRECPGVEAEPLQARINFDEHLEAVRTTRQRGGKRAFVVEGRDQPVLGASGGGIG